LNAARREAVQKKIENLPFLLNNLKRVPEVQSVNKLDGQKVIFRDGSWTLIRLSGTEPVARCYCEARSPGKLKQLRREVERILTSD
jgi:phosphomannomutase